MKNYVNYNIIDNNLNFSFFYINNIIHQLNDVFLAKIT